MVKSVLLKEHGVEAAEGEDESDSAVDVLTVTVINLWISIPCFPDSTGVALNMR